MSAGFVAAARAVALGLALILSALSARADVAFDGTRDIELAAPARFTLDALQRITLEGTIDDATTGLAPLLSIEAGADALVIAFDADKGIFSRLSAASLAPVPFGPRIAPGTPIALSVARTSGGQWQVDVGNGPVPLGPKELSAAGTATTTLTLGGKGFVGTLSAFRATVSGSDPITLADDGTLAPTFEPQLGVYTMVDGEINTPQIADITGLASHSIYEREHFFALEEWQDGYVLIFDWGGHVPLRVDDVEPRSLVAARPRDFWIGRLRFPAGSSSLFHAEDVRAWPLPGVLRDGRSYQFFDNSSALAAVEGKQNVREVWAIQDFPDGFDFARRGCFDITRMNFTDLSVSRCPNTLFDFPSAKGANYTEGFGKIVPFGWLMNLHPTFSGGVVSTLVESSTETASEVTGGSGYDFSLLGLDVSNETATSASNRAQLASEQMMTLHRNFASKHALVLDPTKVTLHPCFIKKVLRAAPGATPPPYFPQLASDLFSASYGYNLSGERCTEAISGPNLVPIETKDLAKLFIGAYGTHFAHAITFGALGYQYNYHDKKTITDALERSQSGQSGVAFDLDTFTKALSAKAKTGVNVGSSQNNETVDGTTLSSTIATDNGKYYCLGGSGCTNGHPEMGDGLIPVALQLRPIDDLLAPPFFTDPRITITLRGAVREALAKVMKDVDVPDEPLIPFSVFELSATKTCTPGAVSSDFPTDGDELRPRLCNDASPFAIANQLAVQVTGSAADGTGRKPLEPDIRVPFAQFDGDRLFIPLAQPSPAGQDALTLALEPLFGATTANGACSGQSCKIPFSIYGDIETVSREPCDWAKIQDLSDNPFAGGVGDNESACIDDLPDNVPGEVYDDLSVRNWNTALLGVGKSDSPASGSFTGHAITVPLPRGARPSTFDETVLTLDPAKGTYLKYDDLGDFALSLGGSLSQVDVHERLGFAARTAVDLGRRTPTSLSDVANRSCGPGFRTHDWGCYRLSDARACPPGLLPLSRMCIEARRGEGPLLAFENPLPSGIVARFEVEYRIQGVTLRRRTSNLAAGRYELMTLPRETEHIVVIGTYATLLRGHKEMFRRPVDPHNPIDCFAARGTAFNARVITGCI